MIWGTYFVTIIIKKFYLSNIWFEQRWKEGTEYQQGIMAGHYKGIFFENVFLRMFLVYKVRRIICTSKFSQTYWMQRKYIATSNGENMLLTLHAYTYMIYMIYDTLFVIHHILYAVYTVYLFEIMSKKLK